MENQVIRQSNGDYRIGEFTVEMFGSRADSCTCARFVVDGEECEHMPKAEQAEKQFQAIQQGEPPPHPFQQAELTRRAGFTLLK